MRGDDLASSAPRPPSDSLFRPEAVAEQQDRWLGSVVLVPRVSHTVFTAVAAVIVVGVIGLFTFGKYTHKAQMGGWLVPEQGLIHIVAPEPGVLSRVQAQEGWEVEAGTPLAVLSVERRSRALGATQGEVVRQLRARLDSLLAERDRQVALFAQQSEMLTSRLKAISAEAGDIEKEFALQRARRELAEQAAVRQRALRERGLATENTWLEAQGDALDQALALQTLERSRVTLARERAEVEAARAEAPLREQVRLAEIDRAAAAIEQELAEAEALREIVITAPEAGTVTALQSASGSSVGPDRPLMTLVPTGSTLVAQLYGPSRAIGFVRPGQRVLLRYHAFPYQKFGKYEGVVKSVTRTTIGAAELSGLGAERPGLATAGEPVYRITVTLASQTATAYGKKAALQSGMQLEADVLIETRQIYEWVLDPLYSLTGRAKA
jgi:membrane fusion protein